MIRHSHLRVFRRIALIPLPFASRALRYYADISEIKQESEANESDHSPSTTGVIETSNSEVVLYYDQIYPLGLSHSVLKQYLAHFFMRGISDSQLRQRVLAAAQPLPPDSDITELVPTRRDGGAFVKFRMHPSCSEADFIDQIRENTKRSADKIQKNIFRHLMSFVWNPIPTVYPVKGRPWIEDLRRFPSRRLKVISEGSPLTEEEIYLLFRRYGFITDIIPGKEYATVIFSQKRSAVCAKNCVTGIVLNKGATTLHLQFIPDKRANFVIDFIINHQKVSVPLILALLATGAVLIFDPIRQWFVETKITHRYLLDRYKNLSVVKAIIGAYTTVNNWLTRGYYYIDEQLTHGDDDKEFSGRPDSSSFSIWEERFEMAKQLKLWILENVNTFIIVKGPKGAGKSDFVMHHTLEQDEQLSKNILVLNCDRLSKCRLESKLIKEAADQLGYFPVFTWTNSISQFADLALQGLTGLKTGLSELVETQIKNMFSLTSQAIRSVSLENYEKYVSAMRKKNKKLKTGEAPVEIIKEDAFLQLHPQAKPIIVIDKFASKSDSRNNEFLYQLIAEWASGLIQNNLAHVIFVTSDVGSVQQLNEALPNLVFKMISLADARSSSARQYVLSQVESKDSASIEQCLAPLGGRMLDLQAFVRRINSGESPGDAISEMVSQSAEQVTTFFLNNHLGEGGKSWDTAQIWYIIRQLAHYEEVEYKDLLASPLFPTQKEASQVLSSLEKHDLVVLKRDKGVLVSVCAGRPLYKAAFKDLVKDPRVYQLYEKDYLKALISIWTAKIATFEEELRGLPTAKIDLRDRVEYLVEKIELANEKIVKLERDMSSLSANQSTGSRRKGWWNII